VIRYATNRTVQRAGHRATAEWITTASATASTVGAAGTETMMTDPELTLAKAMFWHAWHSIFWMPAALASAMFLLLAGVTLFWKKETWNIDS
jgi:hypothetical protein